MKFNPLFIPFLFIAIICFGCKNISERKVPPNNSNENSLLESPNSSTSIWVDNGDQNYFESIPFRDDLKNALEDLDDTIYVCSREKLTKIEPLNLEESKITYDFKTSNQNHFSLKIQNKSFEVVEHEMQIDTIWREDGKYYLMSNDTIDGKRSIGTDGNIPTAEIEKFSLNVNQKEINLPSSIYNNLYSLKLDRTEVYETKDGNHIYVYLSGSDGAAYYSVKLVFSIKGFSTRILAILCGYDFIDGVRFDCV